MKRLLIITVVLFCIPSLLHAARAAQAPRVTGTVLVEGKPVNNAKISLVSRFPDVCQALTTHTNAQGKFVIGPLCEYQTKIPSVILNERVMFGYHLVIKVGIDTYLWNVLEDGYAPFTQQVTIDLSQKTLCITNKQHCVDLFWQRATINAD